MKIPNHTEFCFFCCWRNWITKTTGWGENVVPLCSDTQSWTEQHEQCPKYSQRLLVYRFTKIPKAQVVSSVCTVLSVWPGIEWMRICNGILVVLRNFLFYSSRMSVSVLVITQAWMVSFWLYLMETNLILALGSNDFVLVLSDIFNSQTFASFCATHGPVSGESYEMSPMFVTMDLQIR